MESKQIILSNSTLPSKKPKLERSEYYLDSSQSTKLKVVADNALPKTRTHKRMHRDELLRQMYSRNAQQKAQIQADRHLTKVAAVVTFALFAMVGVAIYMVIK